MTPGPTAESVVVEVAVDHWGLAFVGVSRAAGTQEKIIPRDAVANFFVRGELQRHAGLQAGVVVYQHAAGTIVKFERRMAHVDHDVSKNIDRAAEDGLCGDSLE